MSLEVKRSVSFTILNLKDSNLSNHTSYRNFSHISIVTFDLSSISKNLRRKRISVPLSRGEKIYLSHPIFAIAATTFDLYRSFIRTFIINKKEDAIVLRDIKMRIDEAIKQWSSGAMENKAADKAIGA